MKTQRLLGALCAGLMLLTAPAQAAEQASLVTPVTGPMDMAKFAGVYLNPALRALGSCNWGTSAPANGPGAAALPYQCWADTTSNPVLFKRYDGSSWVVTDALNTSTHVWTPYRNGAPIVAVATSGSATDLTAGTLPAARLPNPSASTPGGIQAKSCSASQWLMEITTGGVPNCAPVTKSDVGLGNADNTSDATKNAAAATLANKTLASPTINTPAVAGGTASGLTGFGLRDTSAAFDLNIVAASSPALTGNRTLTINIQNVSETISLNGSLTLSSNFATAGGFPLTLTETGATNVTLPTIGTLSTLAGAETLSNKTLVAPALGTPASGVATNLTGTAAGLTAGNVTTNANLTGEVTSVGNATTVTNASVVGKVLTAFAGGAGTVSSSDSILTALQKIVGNIALKADLASPTLSGIPRAPTAPPSNNSTQLATTAYVDNQVSSGVSGVSALNGQTGSLVSFFAPQGRLTLTSGTPEMTTSVAAATTVYYTAGFVPIFDGTNTVPTLFPEVSQATTDTTKSPAAVAPNACYYMFAWVDAGTKRVTRGPAWTNISTPGSGNDLNYASVFPLNNVAITNGPGALRGTYVGIICSNASSTIDYIFGAVSTGGTAAVFNVWNAYNRVTVITFSGDSTSSWPYATTINTWRAANSSSSVRVTFVRGSSGDGVSASYNAQTAATSTSTYCAVGIGLDSPSSVAGSPTYAQTTNVVPLVASYNGTPSLGQHYLQALEYIILSSGCTYYGGPVPYIQTGISASLRQ